MKTSDILTILAILVGPVLAVEVSIWREGRNRRLNLFRTLMVTRGSPVSFDHVRALNSIDVEFYRRRKVRAAWKLYFDHLCVDPANPGWFNRSQDLLTGLLMEMASSLGLTIDEADVRRMTYTPTGHGALEQDQGRITAGLAKLLADEKPLWISAERPIQPPSPPAAPQPQERPTPGGSARPDGDREREER